MLAGTVKHYPQYRASGVEWLGEIPAHWQVNRLKFVAPIRSSKMTSAPPDQPFVGLENIEPHTGRLLLDTGPSEPESVVGWFAAGDVLVGKLRPYLAKVARPAFDGISTTELVALQPNGMLAGFLFYALLNTSFIHWLDSLTFGSKMPRVSPEQIANTFIPVPPGYEQQAIADFLDRETARIDALVERKQNLVDLLEEERTALISRSVTRGLAADVPMQDTGVEWLGEIPAHWDVRRLRTFAQVVNGATPSTGTPAYWNGDIAWITPEDLGKVAAPYIDGGARSITQQGYEACGTTIVPAGSIVISTRAPIGHLAILRQPACVNQGCRLVVPTGDAVVKYLYYQLTAARHDIASLGQGSTFTELSRETLATYRIAWPPPKEQASIVRSLDREIAKLDALVAKVQEAIERIKEYRVALIFAAVTGNIDVRGEAAH